MAERPNYTLDENPTYTEEIPALQNDDPASANDVFNPLITKILNNQKANHLLANGAQNTANGAKQIADAAIPKNQLGMANGVPTLDSSGKIPKSQLPATGGYVRQTTAPMDTSLLWMDSGHSDIMKYYNGTAWTPQPSVWGPET